MISGEPFRREGCPVRKHPRHSTVRRGKAGSGVARAVYSGLSLHRGGFPVAIVPYGGARPGAARLGELGYGMGCWSAYWVFSRELSAVRRRHEVRSGKAGRGRVRPGVVWHGLISQRTAHQRVCCAVRKHHAARQCAARRGMAGLGAVRHGLDVSAYWAPTGAQFSETTIKARNGRCRRSN